MYGAVYASWVLMPFQVFAIGTFGITVNDLMIFVFLAWAVFRMVWRGESLAFTPSVATTCLLAFPLVVLLSLSGPIVDGFGFVQFAKSGLHWLYLWLFAVVTVGFRDESEVWLTTLRVVVGVSVVIALFGVYQLVARVYDWPLAWIEITNLSIHSSRSSEIVEGGQLALQFENFFRATSIFSEPSVLASFSVVCLVYVGMALIQNHGMVWRKSWAVFAVVSLFVALFLTFSLTGVVQVVAVIALMAILERKDIRNRIGSGIALCVLLVVLADVLVQPLTGVSLVELFVQRIEGIVGVGGIGPYSEHIVGESFTTRTNSMATGFAIFAEYPLAGAGIGRFSQTTPAIVSGYLFSDAALTSVFAEQGLIGGIVFTTLIVGVFGSAIYWFKRSSELSATTRLLVGLCPYLGVILIIKQIIANDFIHAWLWLSIALILAICNRAALETNAAHFSLSAVQQNMSSYVQQRLVAAGNLDRSSQKHGTE